MGHVVWDWNGTLLDDLDLLVEATSAALVSLGELPVDVEAYRTHHRRPLTRFYAGITGRQLTEDELIAVGVAFNASYTSILPRAGLASDATAALSEVRLQGFSQSLLSMWGHEQLGPLVEKLGLAPYFERIDGLTEQDGDTKAASLDRHIRKLEAESGRRLDRSETTLVGDTMDDGHAAFDVGINCVLVATGAQHLADLETVGWPVALSLLGAVDLVLDGGARTGSAPKDGDGTEG